MNKLKVYNYNVTTNVLWTSFDYGTVCARNFDEAVTKAVKKLTKDFDAINAMIKSTGHSIYFDKDSIIIEAKK